mgnify:CR=1 FL=1
MEPQLYALQHYKIDARQLEQYIEIIRHLTLILFLQNFHAGADIPCFAVAKPAGLTILSISPTSAAAKHPHPDTPASIGQ